MFVFHLLPIAPWLRTPLSVILLVMVVVSLVATWLPVVLACGIENWRRVGRTVRRDP